MWKLVISPRYPQRFGLTDKSIHNTICFVNLLIVFFIIRYGMVTESTWSQVATSNIFKNEKQKSTLLNRLQESLNIFYCVDVNAAKTAFPRAVCYVNSGEEMMSRGHNALDSVFTPTRLQHLRQSTLFIKDRKLKQNRNLINFSGSKLLVSQWIFANELVLIGSNGVEFSSKQGCLI